MKLRVGDTIKYKPRGNNSALTAVVERIEICRAGLKYGRSVSSCDLDKHSSVVLDLDNDHWCEKQQIIAIL